MIRSQISEGNSFSKFDFLLFDMLKDTKNRFGILSELFRFLWKRKMYWLFPMVALLVVFGLLLVFAASNSAVAPFIYTLF